MNVDRDKVKVIYKDDATNTVTSGYDEIISNQHCLIKDNDVEITLMYREINRVFSSGKFFYKCDKSEKIIQYHPSGDEFSLCIDGSKCAKRCICYNCLASCGSEQKWVGENGDDTNLGCSNVCNEVGSNIEQNQTFKEMINDMFNIIVQHSGYDNFDIIYDGAYGYSNYENIKGKLLLDTELTGEERQILHNAIQKTRYYFNSCIDKMGNSTSFVSDFNKFDTYYKFYLISFYGKELKDPPNTYPGAGGCYIATAVYGDYNAPEVKILRRFRDEVLFKFMAGRLFIKLYYALSPPVADWLKNAKTTNVIVRRALDSLVMFLNR